MRILFDITHPAHVHLFRNAINELNREGHDVFVASRDKDLTIELLDIFDIKHTVLSRKRHGFLSLAIEWTIREVQTYRYYRSVDPDIVVSRFNPAASHATTLLNIPHLVFDDTEDKPEIVHKIANPYSDVIYTPDCYSRNLGPHQVRYPGYHELAYLHPNHFEPNPAVKDRLVKDSNRPVVILRLVSWDAVHDVGESGFNDIRKVVAELEATGAEIIITSEDDLPADLTDYQISLAPHEIHDALYFSDLYLGESATMATESAVLGTPAVFVSSTSRGYTDELEDKYGLVFNFSDRNRHEEGMKKSLDILSNYSTDEWDKKRKLMLKDKIDTTDYIIDEIHKYT